MPASCGTSARISAQRAVDALLVLVAERYAAALGDAGHLAHAVDYLLAEVFRLFILGDVEGKEADIFALQRLRDFDRVAELFQMRRIIVLLDIDLADRRTDGPDDESRVLHLAKHFFRLFQRNVGNVLAVHIADFQALQAVALHRGDLQVDGRRRFVGKSKNSHDVSFLYFICSRPRS